MKVQSNPESVISFRLIVKKEKIFNYFNTKTMAKAFSHCVKLFTRAAQGFSTKNILLLLLFLVICILVKVLIHLM